MGIDELIVAWSHISHSSAEEGERGQGKGEELHVGRCKEVRFREQDADEAGVSLRQAVVGVWI